MREWIARFFKGAPPAASGGPAAPALLLDGVGVRGVLRGLQFVLAAGRMLAVVGAAGSGKSRLLETLAGLSLPSEGRLEILGAPPGSARLRRKVALAPARLPQRPGSTLGRILRHQAALCGLGRKDGEARVQELALILGLARRLAEPAAALEPLEAAMACLAFGLIRKPAILCADAPSRALERADTRAWWNELSRLRAEGLTVVAASRALGDPWRVADEVLVLRGGRAWFPAPEELSAMEGLTALLVIYLESPPAIFPPELAAFRPLVEGRTLKIRLADPASHLADVVGAILNAGLRILDLEIQEGDLLVGALQGGRGAGKGWEA